jgi:hypothetical protein
MSQLEKTASPQAHVAMIETHSHRVERSFSVMNDSAKAWAR